MSTISVLVDVCAMALLSRSATAAPGDLESIQSTTPWHFFDQSSIQQITHTYDFSAVTISGGGTLAAQIANIRLQLPSTCTLLTPNYVDWDPSTGTTQSYTWTFPNPAIRTQAEHIAELEDKCGSGYSLVVTYAGGVTAPGDVTAGNIPTTIEYTYAATERGEGGYHAINDPTDPAVKTHWYLGHYRCQQLGLRMCAFHSESEWDAYDAVHTSKVSPEHVYIAAYRWPNQEGMMWVDNVSWTHPDPENSGGLTPANFLSVGQTAFQSAAENVAGIDKAAIDANGDTRWFSTGSRATNNDSYLNVVAQLTNSFDNLESWYPWRSPKDPDWNVNLGQLLRGQTLRPFTIRIRNESGGNEWNDWETDGYENRHAQHFCCRGNPVVVHEGTLNSPITQTNEPTSVPTSHSPSEPITADSIVESVEPTLVVMKADESSDFNALWLLLLLLLLPLSALIAFLAIRRRRRNKTGRGKVGHVTFDVCAHMQNGDGQVLINEAAEEEEGEEEVRDIHDMGEGEEVKEECQEVQNNDSDADSL